MEMNEKNASACGELEAELVRRFNIGYEMRFDDGDIEWKKTWNKNKRTGELTEGKPLAYLSWAVAVREFRRLYPEGRLIVESDPCGSPLINVNGYGMIKVTIEFLRQSYSELYPIMKGGANDAMKMEEIDSRDVNDAIQRGTAKAIAKYAGIGLYIYEGKLDKKAPIKKAQEPIKAQSTDLPTADDISKMEALIESKGLTKDQAIVILGGKDYSTMMLGELRTAYKTIREFKV